MSIQHTTPRPEPTTDETPPSSIQRTASQMAPKTFSHRMTDRLRNLIDEHNVVVIDPSVTED